MAIINQLVDGKSVEVVSLVNKKQAIRVDENSPILAKATKVESLCTIDRDYYLLDADAVTESDLNNLSSLQQSDSLSTTISEESDSVHVYDLNKRETKILRHGIIKLSRNPIGEYDDTHTSDLAGRFSATASTSSSPLDSTIQQFNRKIFEHAKETRKPPVSPTKLKSVHLNRNPRKFKMADMNLSSKETVADGTNEGTISTNVTAATSSSDNNNVEIIERTIESETHEDGSTVTVTTEVVETTQQLLENGREQSAIAVVTKVEQKSSTRNEQEENSNISEEVFHVEQSCESERIFDRPIGQSVKQRRLADTEIVFDKQVIDSDDEAHVEIVPATSGETIEYVDHGNVTVQVIRENQLEVVIVSPTHRHPQFGRTNTHSISTIRFRQMEILRNLSSKRM